MILKQVSICIFLLKMRLSHKGICDIIHDNYANYILIGIDKYPIITTLLMCRYLIEKQRRDHMINRGFFTLATGDEKYYKFANNLLHSYRLHNSDYPFAILCDRHNKYTKDFDQVIILDNVKKNYLDKFRILKDAPFYESIFIEPDCLIYRDISCFFDLLAKDSDLSSFGWNNGNLSEWFNNPEKIISVYGDKITTIPVFCPGYMFVRKTEKVKTIFNDLLEIAEWITENYLDTNPQLLGRGVLRDDPIFFIAMRINNCVCAEKPSIGKCIYLPRVKKIKKISFRSKQLNVIQEKEYDNCNLLHFTTRRCVDEGLYWHQIICLKMCKNSFPIFIIKIFEKKFFYLFLDLLKRAKLFIKCNRQMK